MENLAMASLVVKSQLLIATLPIVSLKLNRMVSLGTITILNLAIASSLSFSDEWPIKAPFNFISEIETQTFPMPLVNHFDSFRGGVFPIVMLKISDAYFTFHPFGIFPNSESTNLPPLNGSKSMNQDLKRAFACSSKLLFI
jgi:hypothetical protein